MTRMLVMTGKVVHVATNSALKVQEMGHMIVMISLLSPPSVFLWHPVLLDVSFPTFSAIARALWCGVKVYAVLLFSAQIAAFLSTYRVLEIYKLPGKILTRSLK